MNSPPARLALARRRLRWDQTEMARYLGRSREWVSRLENGRGEFSEIVLLKLAELERVQSAHTSVPPLRAGSVGEAAGRYDIGPATHGMVAPLHASPAGAPSTREDCERYMRALIEAAARSGEADAWPEIHARLKRHLPLSDWEPRPTL